MNKWGLVATYFIILIVISSGCTLLGGGKSNDKEKSSIPASIETPTLPDQYVAPPVGILNPSPGTAILNSTLRKVPVINSAALITINGTGLEGGNDSSSSNSSSSSRSSSVPIVQFTSIPSAGAMGLAPLTVRFTDTSLNIPTAWSWDFGDGNTSSDKNPVHTYKYGGRYSVALTATNSAGSTTITLPNYISVYEPRISAIPLKGHSPLDVTFMDTGSGYPLPISGYWDFGDNSLQSYSRNSSHRYLLPGVYGVHYRVTIPGGNSMWINTTSIMVT